MRFKSSCKIFVALIAVGIMSLSGCEVETTDDDEETENTEKTEKTGNCESYEFNCGQGNGGCICTSLVCDGNNDCTDGLDEENCGTEDNDCEECVMNNCATETNNCVNDAACVGTDCTCCAGYMSDETCTGQELDTDSRELFDALGICACTHCATECADMCNI